MPYSTFSLVNTIVLTLNIYSALVLIRVLLTWFPNINWYSQPFSALSQITDPYLNVFRSLIPPLGGIDFSPVLALFALNLISNLFVRAVTGVVF